MNLYRAFYITATGKGRGMTFTADDAATAVRIADDWQINDKLLTVKLLRPANIQPQLFDLQPQA